MSKQDRDYIFFIEDIINAIEKIERYIVNLNFDEFKKNEMAIDAVVRNFEIIGEASNKIPEHIKTKYPNIEWKEAIGFRNILIHDYFGIDLEAVWDTILKNIPVLKEHIKYVLDQESGKR